MLWHFLGNQAAKKKKKKTKAKTKPENSLLETILHWEGTETGEETDKFPTKTATNATISDDNKKAKMEMDNKWNPLLVLVLSEGSSGESMDPREGIMVILLEFRWLLQVEFAFYRRDRRRRRLCTEEWNAAFYTFSYK